MFPHSSRLRAGLSILVLVPFLSFTVRRAAAQSSQVDAEWALFNQILFIGIAVGIVVFGLLFYALIKYRERPAKAVAK